MEEAIRRADANDHVILSNKRLDAELVNKYWNGGMVHLVLTCWGGTMVGYDEPGKPLGKTIEYVDKKSGIRYIFPVPKEYIGEKDIALAVEHPDFTLEKDKNDRVVHAKEVGMVPEFPDMEKTGSYHWYLVDPRYGIPSGKEVRYDEHGVRFLFRIRQRVGLIARADHYFHGPFNVPELKMVGISNSPSDKLGLAVEAPEPPKRTRSGGISELDEARLYYD